MFVCFLNFKNIRKKLKLEEEVELMDIKAEVLYGQLIEMLGGDVDHEEINYIIKLVFNLFEN